MTRYYRCRKCGFKVVATYLGQHWLNKHFELMYVIIETESQAVFSLDGETGKVKPMDIIYKTEGSPI